MVKAKMCKFNFETYLVGGFNPSEKYLFVSWNDYSQYTIYIYIWKNKIHVPNHQPDIKFEI